MRTAARFIGVVCAVLGAAAGLTACGGDSSTDTTFGCSGGGTNMTCLANTQYCEQATSSGTITRATCRALPTGCSGDPCANCLMSGSNGIIQCLSIPFGSARVATVSVRN